MNCSIMKIPCGFKIRKKVDCDTFIKECMCKEHRYYVICDEVQIILEKDKDGNVSVLYRTGDFNDVFNPSVEMARTKNNCYKLSVQDYIWKYRKAINKKWFNEV